MQLSFVETMAGTLRDEAGAEDPVLFRVASSGVGRGHFTLKGVITAGRWTKGEKTAAEGTLTITALPAGISYLLRFEGASGPCTLEAKKTPTLLAPVRSMTLMPAVVKSADGQVLARGEMRFELAQLPTFLASWVVRGQRRALDVQRRQLERAGLSR